MSRRKKIVTPRAPKLAGDEYAAMLADVVKLLEAGRKIASRSINSILTATYWAVGRRIVEQEQGGEERASYGERLLQRLSSDLTRRFGRGFSPDRLETMRLFYLAYPSANISAAGSRKLVKSNSATASRKSDLGSLIDRFSLSWSHYVLLVRQVRTPEARAFYESEALRGGWTVRQLDRQISSQFYERILLSRKKAALLHEGASLRSERPVTVEEEIKDPFVLEFLGLKDEYSESDLEAALIQKLESFLLELGVDFTFVGRQRRLRVGHEWYRVDLLFFHRKLRCLVVIDLKVGKFTHADAGQMHLYLNYAREHWMLADENPPVGLILCAQHDAAVAHYALEGLPNKVLAAEYRMALPDEKMLAAELRKATRLLESRQR